MIEQVCAETKLSGAWRLFGCFGFQYRVNPLGSEVLTLMTYLTR
jgi:hypothetical protein